MRRPDRVEIIRRGADPLLVRDQALRTALRRAAALTAEHRRAQAALIRARAAVLRRLGPHLGDGAVTLRSGSATLRVTPREEVLLPEANVREARRLLGRRFSRMVRSRRLYFCRRELLGHPEARGLLEVRTLAPRFTFLAGQGAPRRKKGEAA
ncbi:MAG: hypothetical protein P8Y66_08505 [Nitrospirota bacterium]|jgi:hypothetical protein